MNYAVTLEKLARYLERSDWNYSLVEGNSLIRGRKQAAEENEMPNLFEAEDDSDSPVIEDSHQREDDAEHDNIDDDMNDGFAN